MSAQTFIATIKPNDHFYDKMSKVDVFNFSGSPIDIIVTVDVSAGNVQWPISTSLPSQTSAPQPVAQQSSGDFDIFEIIDPDPGPIIKSPKACSCSTHQLMWGGCICGCK